MADTLERLRETPELAPPAKAPLVTRLVETRA